MGCWLFLVWGFVEGFLIEKMWSLLFFGFCFYFKRKKKRHLWWLDALPELASQTLLHLPSCPPSSGFPPYTFLLIKPNYYLKCSNFFFSYLVAFSAPYSFTSSIIILPFAEFSIPLTHTHTNTHPHLPRGGLHDPLLADCCYHAGVVLGHLHSYFDRFFRGSPFTAGFVNCHWCCPSGFIVWFITWSLGLQLSFWTTFTVMAK